MNKPAVSVVMVACNVDRFLAEAIESVLGQTFRDFEFIIVDFGSTDKSKEIISNYAAKDSRVKMHEIPHCNLADARNAGAFLAQGQYMAVMDADDVSLLDRLSREVEFMEKHPLVGVVGGAVDWIDATGELMHSPWQTLCPPVENSEIQSVLLKYNPFWQSSVLMRTEAFVLTGGYREAFAPAEDYDLWLRIAEHFEMANLDRVLLHYRIHPYQVSVRNHKQQNLSGLAALASAASRRSGKPDPLNKVKEVTPELLVKLGVGEAQQQSALAIGYWGWIHTMCAAGEWKGALSAAIEMLRSSDWKYIERRALADMRLEVAQLYWKNQEFLMSIITAGHAVATRPMLAGRPLKSLLHRLGVV